jgi:hypothetical protein
VRAWLVAVALLVLVKPAFAADERLEAVRRLYNDFPATGHGVQNEPPPVLSRYFDRDLVRLFVRDAACAEKNEGICNLDFDPIWAAHDAERGKVSLSSGPRNLITARITYPRAKPIALLYDVRLTKDGWRVHDIIGPSGGPTLRQQLAQ